MKKRYPVRDLTQLPNAKDVPEDTWLYDHPGAFKMKPDLFPPNCTWCKAKLVVTNKRWRSCPTCDAGDK